MTTLNCPKPVHHKHAQPVQSCAAPTPAPPCLTDDPLTPITQPAVYYKYLAGAADAEQSVALRSQTTGDNMTSQQVFYTTDGGYQLGLVGTPAVYTPTAIHKTPEIDPASGIAAVTMLVIALLILRAKIKVERMIQLQKEIDYE
jgi:hypothetical protein